MKILLFELFMRNRRMNEIASGFFKCRNCIGMRIISLVNGTAQLSREIVIGSMEKALKLWESVSPLRFFRARSEETADMVFTFFRGEHGLEWDEAFDGNGMVTAHAWVPMPGNTYSGHIHFDADENWVNRSNISTHTEWESVEFYSTAVHELGHSMGLGHSDKYESVMRPYYGDYEGKLTLGYDDALAMYKLYVESGKFDDVGFPPPDPKDYKQPLCHGSFDAILFRSSSILFFKSSIYWISEDGFGTTKAPLFFKIYWKFTHIIEKIDAAYQRDIDGKYVFFTGREYWIFDNYTLENNRPQPLTSLGFHEDVDSIDAAMNWKEDGKTYFFKGCHYWCYNETTSQMETGYPRLMLEWKDAPDDIDAAFSLENGTAYFFKGDYYWEINEKKEVVNPNNPMLAKDWLGCDW